MAGVSRRLPPWLGAVPAVLLVAVAVWEIVATRVAASSTPGDDAWSEAAAVVRAAHRPGDLIVFAPDWVDPVGRLHLGDLIPVADAARMDAARYGRIWELSIRGARSGDTAGLSPVVTTTRGGVTVRRFERTPVKIVSDLRELVSGARVEGGRTITVELAEVGFTPRWCIQAVPAPKLPMKITFPAVSLGSELVGYVGIADVFTRRDLRKPARLSVAVDGGEVARAIAGVDDGWVRFSAVTPAGAHDVTVTVSSDDGNRQICFAAEARQ